MDSLFLNFLKRAFLVPILVAALAAGAITVAVPVLAAHSTRIEAEEKTAEQSVDITKYTLHSYNNFKELAEGNLVGTIRCENISLGEKAIIYSKAEKSNIVLNKASVEPWKKGGVLLVGSNTSEQFKVLHNAKKGDVLEVTIEGEDEEEYYEKLKKLVCTDCFEKSESGILKVAFYGTKDYDRLFFSKLADEKGPGTYNVDITYLESRLTAETAALSKGHDAVCIFVNDEAPREVIEILHNA